MCKESLIFNLRYVRFISEKILNFRTASVIPDRLQFKVWYGNYSIASFWTGSPKILKKKETKSRNSKRDFNREWEPKLTLLIFRNTYYNNKNNKNEMPNTMIEHGYYLSTSKAPSRQLITNYSGKKWKIIMSMKAQLTWWK